jgi:hypothetical protein
MAGADSLGAAFDSVQPLLGTKKPRHEGTKREEESIFFVVLTVLTYCECGERSSPVKRSRLKRVGSEPESALFPVRPWASPAMEPEALSPGP